MVWSALDFSSGSIDDNRRLFSVFPPVCDLRGNDFPFLIGINDVSLLNLRHGDFSTWRHYRTIASYAPTIHGPPLRRRSTEHLGHRAVGVLVCRADDGLLRDAARL